ncbi:MAG: hypothetical protein KC620_10310, partial [Myxococcales bacterium]|nr:hypothetical protein [Myxococcales bacterium]
MKRPALAFAIVAALLCASGAVLIALQPAAPRTPAAETAPLRLQWPRGQALRYRFSHRARHDVRALGGASATDVAGRIDLAGTLTLRSHGKVGRDCALADGAVGATCLSLRIDTLDTHDITVLGKALLPDAEVARAQLVSREALLEVAPDGSITRVRFTADAPVLFQTTAQLLASELQVQVGDGRQARWTAFETTPNGQAVSDYALAGRDADGAALVRTRRHYDRLQALAGQHGTAPRTVAGEARIALAAAGFVRSVDNAERITVDDGGERVLDIDATTRFALEEVGLFDGRLTADFGEPLALGQHRADPEAGRRALTRRADGLTADDLLNTLAEFAAGGALPHQNEFLWRAAALLRLHPELCARLAELFAQAETGRQGRRMILDLLTSAGTPAAQAALRAALASDAALNSDDYPQLFARLSLVADPTEETLALLRDRHATPGPEGEQAAAFALGAAAGAAVRGAHPGEGQRIAD